MPVLTATCRSPRRARKGTPDICNMIFAFVMSVISIGAVIGVCAVVMGYCTAPAPGPAWVDDAPGRTAEDRTP